eukprot:757445-Hanusia_phi.AAC.2
MERRIEEPKEGLSSCCLPSYPSVSLARHRECLLSAPKQMESAACTCRSPEFRLCPALYSASRCFSNQGNERLSSRSEDGGSTGLGLVQELDFTSLDFFLIDFSRTSIRDSTVSLVSSLVTGNPFHLEKANFHETRA